MVKKGMGHNGVLELEDNVENRVLSGLLGMLWGTMTTTGIPIAYAIGLVDKLSGQSFLGEKYSTREYISDMYLIMKDCFYFARTGKFQKL